MSELSLFPLYSYKLFKSYGRSDSIDNDNLQNIIIEINRNGKYEIMWAAVVVGDASQSIIRSQDCTDSLPDKLDLSLINSIIILSSTISTFLSSCRSRSILKPKLKCFCLIFCNLKKSLNNKVYFSESTIIIFL